MPIEIIIKDTDGLDRLILDGHYVDFKEYIRPIDILEALEQMGYITIKIEE